MDEGIHAVGVEVCDPRDIDRLLVGATQGDVRKPEDCQRWVDETVAQLGRLDILVNCAAGNFLAAAEMLSPNGFRTG